MHLQMVFQTLFIRAQVFLLCNVLDTWHCWQGGGEVHPWILQFAKPCMLSLPLNSSFMGAWMRCNEHSVAVTQPILPLQKFKNALSVLWVFSEYVLWVFFECSLSVLWMWPLDWSCWTSRDKPSLEIWCMYDVYMNDARKNIKACIINFLKRYWFCQ